MICSWFFIPVNQMLVNQMDIHDVYFIKDIQDNGPRISKNKSSCFLFLRGEQYSFTGSYKLNAKPFRKIKTKTLEEQHNFYPNVNYN